MSTNYSEVLSVFPSLHAASSVPTVRHIKLPAKFSEDIAYELAFKLKSTKPAEVDEVLLGDLGEEVKAGIRLTRDKLFWLTPTPSLELPNHTDTQILLLHLPASERRRYAAVLPLTTPHYMGILRGSPESGSKRSVVARFERDTGEHGEGKLVICFGRSVREVCAGAVEGMKAVRGWGSNIVSDAVDAMKDLLTTSSREEKGMFSDTLTYCTWNSLFPPVPKTATSILRTLEHFVSLSIYPTTLLLDDAWQSVNGYRLASFEISETFRDGIPSLQSLVAKVKAKYGIQRVGCWHTIGGYWQGVDPKGFAKDYQLVKVTKDGYPGPGEGEGFSYYLPHPSEVGRFFDAYYSYLYASGVTFTKCDNMASIDALVVAKAVSFPKSRDGSLEESEVLGEDVDIPSLRVSFKEAVKAAATKYFGGSEAGYVIWCMEMSPRVLLGKEIGGAMGRRSVVRNSDDYYPDVMDSHRYHIFTNAVNATFTAQLNVIPDLDMFQSHAYIPENALLEAPMDDTPSPQAAYHAALRALSAGPVTITDQVGQTNAKILSKLLGMRMKGGRSVALQAQRTFYVGEGIFDGVVDDGDGKALRIWSEAPESTGGVLGLWNTRSGNGKVIDTLCFADILPLMSLSTERPLYAVYSPQTTALYHANVPSASLTPSSSAALHLEPFGFDILTVAPYISAPGKTDVAELSCIGLIDKYNPLAAITRPLSVDEDGNFSVRFKCVGVAGFVISRDAGAAASAGIKVSVNDQDAYLHVRRSWKDVAELVEVDLTPYLGDKDGDYSVLLNIR